MVTSRKGKKGGKKSYGKKSGGKKKGYGKKSGGKKKLSLSKRKVSSKASPQADSKNVCIA